MTCEVEGCDKPRHGRGWCSAHYERWRRTGNVGEAGDARRRPIRPCAADGCTAKGRKRGFCEKHYRRFMRNGHDGLVRAYAAYRSLHTNGYVRVWEPNHPCASRDGYVLEHRKVWYDAHGEVPEHVHHINGNRTDNRLCNLEAMSASDHARRHHLQKKLSAASG